jgi:hypothetical protein
MDKLLKTIENLRKSYTTKSEFNNENLQAIYRSDPEKEKRDNIQLQKLEDKYNNYLFEYEKLYGIKISKPILINKKREASIKANQLLKDTARKERDNMLKGKELKKKELKEKELKKKELKKSKEPYTKSSIKLKELEPIEVIKDVITYKIPAKLSKINFDEFKGLSMADANTELEQGKSTLTPNKIKSKVKTEVAPKKSVGRPKKVVVEPVAPKKSVGRPKKVVVEPVAPKKSVGRPKKVVVEPVVPKKIGRPKKVVVPVELENVVVKLIKPKDLNIEPKSKVGRKKSQASVAENSLLTGLDRFGKPLSAQHLANLQVALNQLKHGIPKAEPKEETKEETMKQEYKPDKETKQKGRKPSMNYDDAIEETKVKYGHQWWIDDNKLSSVLKRSIKHVPIRFINGKLEVYNDGWKERTKEIMPILNNIEDPNNEFKHFFRKNMDKVRQLLIDEIIKKNASFKVQKPKKEKPKVETKQKTKLEKPKVETKQKNEPNPAISFNATNPEIEAPNDTWFKTKGGVIAMLNEIFPKPKPVKYENGKYWEWKRQEDTYYKKGEVKRPDEWVENDELIDEIIRLLPIDPNNEIGQYMDDYPDKLPPIIEAWIKS